MTTVIPKFFNMIATQFDKKIKEFRSDNAKELVFTDFFNDKGVMHQFSYIDRPQQNSVVERKHQHLLNVACALYFQSRIPISFGLNVLLLQLFWSIERLLLYRTTRLLMNFYTRKMFTILYSECLAVLLLLQLFLLIEQSFILEFEFAFFLDIPMV